MATTNSFDRYVVRIAGGNEDRIGLLLCYSDFSYCSWYPSDGLKSSDGCVSFQHGAE